MDLSAETAYTDEAKETPVQTFYPGRLFDPFALRVGLVPIRGIPSFGLPPGVGPVSGADLENRVIRLGIESRRSYFGDALRAVDVEKEHPLIEGISPFGWSGTELLEGIALTASQLSGDVVVAFGELDGDFLPFQLNHGSGVRGSDSVLAAPSGYRLRSTDNIVVDAFPLTHGRLQLSTGRVYDFHYNCFFWNSAIEALLEANPRLEPPPLLFPGLPHAGHALAWFESTGSALSVTIAAQLFMPLGAERDGEPIRLPPGSPHAGDSSFLARHSSLHPFIFLHAESPGRPGRGRPATETSSVRPILGDLQATHVSMVCCPRESFFGDEFALVSPDLGGSGTAQSPLFGTIDLQFGESVDGYMPFALRLGPPHPDYAEKMSDVLGLLPPGSSPGLVGMHGQLEFPKVTYEQHNLSLFTDPYKASVGVVDVQTGEFASDVVLRSYLFQDLMLALLATEPRTPSDSFAYVGSGRFSRPGDGPLQLDLDAAFVIPYPEGYGFPLPGGGVCRIGPGSELHPFVRLRAVSKTGATTAQPEVMTFVATEHVRGAHTDATAFEIVTRVDGEASLITASRSYEGQVRSAHQVRYGETQLHLGHVEMPDDPLCIYYVTEGPGHADLQIVSSTERFDLWLRGSLTRSPV